ncbi:G-protein coupled receptor Mth2-like isoform X1 [Athalia rosae]|uniref:G-protein coupled receptor Mth2-like isoform X1 n=1 Tax=Athalia rosae TaxID=37344 RepID=UPI0020345CAF|nr:G-protein coupled receptor Mth2-like isoform X1 [Athalia rosae]XP_048508259.1 G-protein coupled receptor Mth2-like isoform X1 [Athalia rosae]XP_048508260.1 G-protein coupled receptor Mth2-like isoform X1 [Athalia rosae]
MVAGIISWCPSKIRALFTSRAVLVLFLISSYPPKVALADKGNVIFCPVEPNVGETRECLCNVKACLAICPPLNDTRTNGSLEEIEDFGRFQGIPHVYRSDLTIDLEGTVPPEKWFHIFEWDPCEGGPAYDLQPDKYPADEFYLLRNGTLFFPRLEGDFMFLDSKLYCLGRFGNDSNYTPRVCSPVEEEKTDPYATANYVGAIISVPFLIVTIVVYSVLKELRNIHGSTLRCYLFCLIATYITLAIDRILPPDYSAGPFCLFVGFTIYISFLASFFWLNVMSVDIWWRFGGFGSLMSRGKEHDRDKFLWYSIYAWGCPIILTAICIGMEFAPGIPESIIRPGFRLRACWFDTKTAGALYFFGPVSLTIACNIGFFISTSVKMIQQNRNAKLQLNSADSQRHDDNKLWFGLYLKLFVVMGISWSTEVISWAWESPQYIWYVTDMVNALQGLLIFFIFVWKKKIWLSLKKRFKNLRVSWKGCISIPETSTGSPSTSRSLDDFPGAKDGNVSIILNEIRNPTTAHDSEDRLRK